MQDDLKTLIGRSVVLDTNTAIVYLGVLKEVTSGGCWLESADVHDCRDGHATKEMYIIEAKRDGIAENRRRVFVMASAVISASALDDIIVE